MSATPDPAPGPGPAPATPPAPAPAPAAPAPAPAPAASADPPAPHRLDIHVQTHQPAPAPAASPAPASPPAPQPAEPPRATVEPTPESIQAVRAEAAAERVRRREAQEALEAERQKSAALQAEREQERVSMQSEREAAVSRERSGRIDAEVRAAAAVAGIIDIDLVPLISREGITVNEQGQLVGVAEAVAAYKTSKPNYFRDVSAAPTPAPAPAPVTTGSAHTPRPDDNPPASNVRELPRGEYRAAKTEALRSLRGVR